MLRRKYLRTQTIAHEKRKPGDSHFWSGLIRVKNPFVSLGHFKLNNGENIIFWKDKWLGNATLQQESPDLYSIAHRKKCFGCIGISYHIVKHFLSERISEE
jgi:hypothetical protein